MNGFLRCSLGLALGLLAGRAAAEDIQWRSSKRAAPDAVTSTPVRIGLPRLEGDASHGPASVFPGMVVRAKAEPDDPKPPLPLPLGPALKGEKNGDGKGKSEYIPHFPAPVSDSLPGLTTGAPHDPCCDTDCCDPCCGPVRGWLKRRWHGCCNLFDHCRGCFDGCRTGPACCEDPCCLQRPHVWGSASYLAWTISQQNLPPLVVANMMGMPVIGAPGAVVAFGGDDMQNELRSGARFEVGFWLPRHDCWGVDFGWFYIGDQTERFNLASPGGAFQIGRPFINSANGLPFSELIAGNGVSGGINIDHSFKMWGVDGHVRRKLSCGPCGWCDALIGFRHVNLDESIDITETPTVTVPGAASTAFVVDDRFGTQNIFNGFDVGFQFERRLWSRWFLQGTAKLAIGNTHQIVDISGMTTRTIAGGAPEMANGGFAALASNIGKFERDRLGIVSEVGIKVGFDVTERLRLYAGYDILWINNVVRAGEQVDPVINIGQVPFRGLPNSGLPRPAVLFRTSDFWAQGAKLGLEYRY